MLTYDMEDRGGTPLYEYLYRCIREDIRWLEGYDESCLEGSERVCILSDEFGYQPGDTVPFLASFSLPEELSDMRGIFRMKVAATYHGKITDFKAVMPIATYEQLCSTATQAHQWGPAWNGRSTSAAFSLPSRTITSWRSSKDT